jgi:hypothetical protein
LKNYTVIDMSFYNKRFASGVSAGLAVFLSQMDLPAPSAAAATFSVLIGFSAFKDAIDEITQKLSKPVPPGASQTGQNNPSTSPH